MDLVKAILQILAALAGYLAALASLLLFTRLRWPYPAWFFLKLYASSLSPVLALVGLLAGAIGLATGSNFISWIGIYVALIFWAHRIRVTRPPSISTGFEQAFGPGWEQRIPSGQKERWLSRRTLWVLPAAPEPLLEQDVVFFAFPDTGRQLLCDVWQPPDNITPSGLAFLYLHGSAWYLLDKDLGTRPFFRHLVAQGHVVMDIAYRLAPETDMLGMIHDVKRAIAWMKEQAASYNVDPDRIVVGGGSAGGHLALMAAYTGNDPKFTPEALAGKDTSVCAVLSLYGPTDLEACYYHTNQHLTTCAELGRPQKEAPCGMPPWMIKRMGDDYHRLGFDKGIEDAGALAPLLGGHPDERPEAYALFSPITHVHPGCPPTLLIHGEHDLIAPVEAARRLFARLQGKEVPAMMHLLPQTDHAFDLIIPGISPSAHSAIYDVERWLGIFAEKEIREKDLWYS